MYIRILNPVLRVLAHVHTGDCTGDDFPVRLRFADLPKDGGGGGGGKGVRAPYQAPPPRQILERGLTTADLKARVALKEKSSVRPPDPDKLGPKQPAKQAMAGSAVAAYAEERWAKTFTVHTKNGPRWVAPEDLKYRDVAMKDPESHPYPWVGRAGRNSHKSASHYTYDMNERFR